MPKPLPHTPCMVIKAGGAGMFSEACQKALASCGINPDDFDTHEENKKSAKQTREKLQRKARGEDPDSPREGDNKKKHLSPCKRENSGACKCHTGNAARDAGTAQEYARANSESGHLNRDAWYRDSGKNTRGDPCQNIPPSDGNAGTMGYDCNEALCMDHYGKARHRGTPHYYVTRQESDFGRSLKDGGAGSVTQQQLESGTALTAIASVTGKEWKWNDDGTGIELADPRTGTKKNSFLPSDQNKLADELSSQYDGASPTSSDAIDYDGLTDTQKTAAACIVAAWKQSLDAMRSACEEEHGPGNADNAKRNGDTWDKLSKEEQDKYLERAGGDPEKAKVLKRQDDLASGGVDMPCSSSPGPPSAAACREYQANYLSMNKDADGKYPNMQGHVGNYPKATTSSASTTGGAQ